MEEGAVLCFSLCYLYYVPRVTETSLKTPWTEDLLITSRLFLLSSFSAAVSFSLLELLQVSGVLGV